MTAKKVLLVANTDWYLFNFRLAFAQYLAGQGLEVILTAPPGVFTDKLIAQGFRFIPWNVGRRTMWPPGEMAAIDRLTRIYRREQPDLVHHFTIKPVLYGSIAASRAKVPAVVNSVTGLGYVFMKKGAVGAALRSLILPLYRSAFSHARMSVTFENVSDQAAFVNLGLVSQGHTAVIPGAGVDADHFRPGREPTDSEAVILFPARMLFDKGLGTLVEAARLLKGRCRVRVILAGDIDPGNPTSADEKTLHAWEQEGLVEWIGFQEDMLPVYRGSMLVVLPSMGEGLPTALIEAAACERPIVTTDVAGCRDVVLDGVNGLLVPPNDPQALALAVEALVQDPERRRQMGKAGRQLVLEKFTDEQVNSQIYSVYRPLIG